MRTVFISILMFTISLVFAQEKNCVQAAMGTGGISQALSVSQLGNFMKKRSISATPLDHCIKKSTKSCLFKKFDSPNNTLVIYLRGWLRGHGNGNINSSKLDLSLNEVIKTYELEKELMTFKE